MIDRKLKVLLVDDDTDDAEMMLFSLTKLSWCDFHYVGDGVDALAYLYSDATISPDIILLDLRMPKIDGIDVLRRLKSDEGRASIPVVVLISSSQGQRYVESFNVKCDGYLLKPVDVGQFITTLSTLGLSGVRFNTEISSNTSSAV